MFRTDHLLHLKMGVLILTQPLLLEIQTGIIIQYVLTQAVLMLNFILTVF